MGRRTRLTREQRREQTRELLLGSARSIFIERGFASTSIEDIAESAGFTRGAFHSNFEDKHELLLELLKRDLDGLLAEISAMARTGGVQARGERVGVACWRRISFEHDCASLGIEATLLARGDAGFRERLNALQSEMAQQIGQAVLTLQESAGRHFSLPPEILGLGLLSLRASVYLFRTSVSQIGDVGAAKTMLVDFIRCLMLEVAQDTTQRDR